MTSNKYFSYLRILLFFFSIKSLVINVFQYIIQWIRGEGVKFNVHRWTPAPWEKKTKKTWAIPRINFTSTTDLPVWSSTFLSHEKTCNDPFITVVSSERLIIQKQANIPRRCVKSLGKWILEIMIPRTYRSRAFTFRNLSYWTSLRKFHFFREVDGPIMEGNNFLESYLNISSLRHLERIHDFQQRTFWSAVGAPWFRAQTTPNRSLFSWFSAILVRGTKLIENSELFLVFLG